MLEGLARDVSPRILRAPARLDGVAREIEEYFAGRRRTFDVPLDLQLSQGFRRTILSHLPEIGYGKTASYAATAKVVNVASTATNCYGSVTTGGGQGAPAVRFSPR